MTKKPNKNNEPLAFSYVRMSTSIQAKGDSLRRQKDLSKKYAEEHGLHLVEQLEDIGISAFKGENAKAGALKNFRDAVDRHDIPHGSYLLVESLDRLSRETIDNAMSQFLDILKAGITIVTLKDDKVYRPDKQDLPQMMYTLMIMSRAHEESEMKSFRLSESWNNKRKNIDSRKLTKRCPGWLALSKDRVQYIAIPERTDVIIDIYNRASNGEGSYSIARELNALKVPTVGRGRLWIKSYITKILQDRSVLGEFQTHKMADGKRIPVNDMIPDYFPRIIDNDLFGRVQAARHSRASSGRGRKGRDVPNLFTNIAKCDYCGSSMHLVNKGKGPKGGTYLKCSKAISSSECIPAAWKYDKFETSFLYFCREIDLRNIVVEAGKRGQRFLLEESITEKKQLVSLKKRAQSDLLKLLETGNASFDVISDRLNTIGTEIREVEDTIEKVAVELCTIIQDDTDQSQLIEAIELFKGDNSANAKFRSRLQSRLKSMIKSLNIGTVGHESFHELRKMSQGGNLYDLRKEVASQSVAFSKEILASYGLPTKFQFTKCGDLSEESKAEMEAVFQKAPSFVAAKYPYFKVEFYDATVRTVLINPKNPLEYSLIVNKGLSNTSISHNWPGANFGGIEGFKLE